MLRFAVYRDGKPVDSVNLDGAYLVGSDGVPVRAEIEFQRGEIICRKRSIVFSSSGPTVWTTWQRRLSAVQR